MKLQVQLPDGSTQEVEVAKLPPGFVSQDVMETEIQRRLRGKVSLEEITSNPELRTQALAALGVKPNAEGPAKLTGEQLEAAQREWDAKFVQPLKLQLEGSAKEVENLRRRDLIGQVLQAAGAVDIKKTLRTQVVKDAPAPIVNMLMPYFGYDKETGQWYVKNGDKFAFSAKPTGDAPYKGIDEFVSEWVADKNNAWVLEDQRQRGPGMGNNTAGQAGSKNVQLSRADMSDHGKYNAAKAEAAKLGGEVEIID